MLVDANDGGVDEDFAKLPISGQFGKYAMPDTGTRPARKSLVRAVPAPKLRWEVSPRTAGARDPQHCLDKQAVVCAAAAGIAALTWQQALDPIPLFIAELLAHHPPQPNQQVGAVF
jgi:hypothetical protein